MQTYLTQAQAKEIITEAMKNDGENLIACVGENEQRMTDPHYLDMLEDLLTNDPVHFSVLSKGCQAAMIFTLWKERDITWAETH